MRTTPRYWKTNEEIALLLTLKPARTDRGKTVHARVLARVEIALAEAELAKELAQ